LVLVLIRLLLVRVGLVMPTLQGLEHLVLILCLVLLLLLVVVVAEHLVVGVG
jgi:hypothetical protein